MTMQDVTGQMPQLLHQSALSAGLTDTIPVIPVGGALHEHSRVDPEARGKVPGDFYGGFWDGMGQWPEYQMTPELAEKWDRLRANVGQKMGYQWAALDVDVTDDLLAHAMRQCMDGLSGGTWPVRIGKAPKALWLFRVTGEPIRRKQFPFRKEGVQGRQLIEVMGVSSKGRPTQAVLFGTHPSGSQYEWNMPLTADAVPYITQQGMYDLVKRLGEVAAGRGWVAGKGLDPSLSDGTGSDLGAEPLDRSLVAPVVELIPNNDLEYDDWVAIGYAIKAAMGAPGWEIWSAFSAKAPKATPQGTKSAWDSFTPDGSTGMGRLVYLAKQACGGMLPGDLDVRVKQGATLKAATNAGMPMVAPIVVQGIEPPQDHGEQVATGANPPWIELVCNDKNEPVANMANAHAYLNNSDQWNVCFAYDAFNDRPVILNPLPGDTNHRVPRWLEDSDYRTVHAWFQRFMWPKIGKSDITDAVDMACRAASFEPVQSYLGGLQWDGVKRIDNWLFTYAGVQVHHDLHLMPYIIQVGRKWLISAVARAMRPGCQADSALILEGSQGKGKSSLFRALVPNEEWFTDGLPDFHTKDAAEHLQGKWLVEMSELTNVIKSDVEDMRRFLTRRVEQFRPSYGKQQVTRPRRTVFCGSTNRDDYLKDMAGERRMWVIYCAGELDINGLAAIRDQLWAEAYAAYKAGETWYLDGEIAQIAQSEQVARVADDPWLGHVQQVTAHMSETTMPDVMLMMGMDLNARSKMAQARIRQCLEQSGFKRVGKCPTTRRVLFRRV